MSSAQKDTQQFEHHRSLHSHWDIQCENLLKGELALRIGDLAIYSWNPHTPIRESLSPQCRGKIAAQNCRLKIMSLKPLPCKTQHFLRQERAGKSQLTDCCAAGAYNLMALRYSGGSQTLQEDPIQGLGFRTFAEACYVRTIVCLSGRCSSSQKNCTLDRI